MAQRRRDFTIMSLFFVLILAFAVLGAIDPGGGGGGSVNNFNDAINGGASAFNVPCTDPMLLCADNDGDCTDEERVEICVDTGTSTPRVVLRDASDNILPMTHSGGVLTPIIDVTAATYAVTAADCGALIRNADADALEVDLLADPTDCRVCVYDNAGGAITVDPNGTDTITKHTVAGGAGVTSVLASGVGNMACFQGTSTTNSDVLVTDASKVTP